MGVLVMASVAPPLRGEPVRRQFSPAPGFGPDLCCDPAHFAESDLSPDRDEIGVGGTEEGRADAPAGGALFEMLQPDSAALGGRELDTNAMVLPGHQADFETITFNWALYLEPPVGAGTRSVLGPDLPLAAYAIGYTRPKREIVAETRYGFAPARMLGGLGLVILCAGLLVSGVVALTVLLRRRGG
jgi:hypothetical protein